MRFPIILLFTLFSSSATAETVFAAHSIRPQSILTAEDLVMKNTEVPGAASRLEDLIGQETRVALYAGRPIRLSDVGPPSVVERNQIVPLIFSVNGLTITTEGRALDRAAPGELIRVMNLSSRNTVTGFVTENGHVIVSR